MDFNNNAVGIALGAKSNDPFEVFLMLLDATAKGDLIVLESKRLPDESDVRVGKTHRLARAT